MGHYPPGDVVPSLRRSHRMFHARHVFISGLRRTTSCWLRTPITFADATRRAWCSTSGWSWPRASGWRSARADLGSARRDSHGC